MGKIAVLHARKTEAKKNFTLEKQKNKIMRSTNSPTERILLLQKTIGNQAVQRLIMSGALHAKFMISQPGDKHEQEADRVAEAVMRNPGQAGLSSEVPHIQRKCPECEELQMQTVEDEEEKVIEAKEQPDQKLSVTSDDEAILSSMRDNGQPLPGSLTEFFEPRFGYDFSRVRIRTDSQASAVARSLNARAFTMGSNIVFGAGEYAPETTDGKRLMAHELTHVLQQGQGQRLMRKAGGDREDGFLEPRSGQSALIPEWIVGEEETTIARKEIDNPGGLFSFKAADVSRSCDKITHLPDGESRVLRAVSGPATGNCSWTCRAGTAPGYATISNPGYNCYAYALSSPASGFLQPGQRANTVEFRALRGDAAAITALGGLAAARAHLLSNYYTPAGVRSQLEADLGSALSPGCLSCCSGSQRKIIAVTTGAMSSVGSSSWDFHWYRKDADKGWSHKPGSTDSRREDAAGNGPICSPCRASRSHPGLDYSHVVGAWCV